MIRRRRRRRRLGQRLNLARHLRCSQSYRQILLRRFHLNDHVEYVTIRFLRRVIAQNRFCLHCMRDLHNLVSKFSARVCVCRDDRRLTHLDSTDIPLVHLGSRTTNRLVRNREKSMRKKSAVGFSCLGQNLQDRSRNRRTYSMPRFWPLIGRTKGTSRACRSPTPVRVSAAKRTICRRPSRLGSRRSVSALSVGPPPESADRNPQCIHRCEQAVNASEERA
jgi:hypothetical protein